MPEGHTIHRLALDLERDLGGQKLAVSSPQGRFTAASRLDGGVLRRAHAVGKHLFLDLGDARVHVHLGLFGKFRRRRPGEPPGPNVRLRLVGGERIWDLTGPTACELMDDDAYGALRSRLGGDPLAEGPRPAATWTRVRASRRAIGALLLDQSIFAGIGNVYRAELLFLVGVHPDTPGRDVSKAQFEDLWRRAKELLRAGVRANRIVTVPLAERRDAPRSRREQLYVYRRTACRRCGSRIARAPSAARTIYFCPTCQRPTRSASARPERNAPSTRPPAAQSPPTPTRTSSSKTPSTARGSRGRAKAQR